MATSRSGAIRGPEPWFHLNGGSASSWRGFQIRAGSGREGESVRMATTRKPAPPVGGSCEMFLGLGVVEVFEPFTQRVRHVVILAQGTADGRTVRKIILERG